MEGRFWTTEQTTELHNLWCVQGHSVNAIRKLTGRTDWSIRGKIKYEGWPTPAGLRKRALQRQATARLNSVRQTGPAFVMPGDTKLLKSPAWRALPQTSPVPMVDLEPGMCKWPIGESSPYLFCGAAAGEASYCPEHTKLSTYKNSGAIR